MAEQGKKEVIAGTPRKLHFSAEKRLCTFEAIMPLGVEPVFVAVPWAVMKAAAAQILTAESQAEMQATQQGRGANAPLVIPI